ncbi:MAG: cell division protein FtsL [Gammaproteobacteria bacterium]|nr:cell division protein FtsL [Gammaproteobacteria bacterium]
MWIDGRTTALAVLVLVSALALAWVRVASREAFVDWQKLQRQRDELNIEWQQLVIEHATWSVPRRVEAVARDDLDMRSPADDEVVVLRAGEQP